MNVKPIFITAVLSAALLAGCDQGADQTGAAPVTSPPPTVTQNRDQPQATPPAVQSQGSQDSQRSDSQGSQTPPTVAERKTGDEPVQGQVDTKEPAQRRTFEAPKG